MSSITSIPDAPDAEARVVDRLQRAGAEIVARDTLPDGRVQLVVSDGSELHRIVVKRERNPWIVAADYAAIGMLTWIVLFCALLAFKAVAHV
jgi:Holliday junction resolvase-like predicted endonuclease